ncbi:unnamed protein product [Ceutorhynchus assimilis]|uniref:Uncharacterized protein n=1 Tax=Ceutorhynchus assimilis TaxID=467358 RepID=A0A9N9MNI9_9CUCU|nr:unnamed protein product [Ceutorhynchus assimilis]
MRGHRQGGGAQPDGLPDDDRNEQGRGGMICWNAMRAVTQLERDIWVVYGLRDYVSYLRRRGYVRGPQQPAVREEQEPQKHMDEEAPPVASEERLRERRALHKTKRPKAQDLARANEELLNALTEEADIWRINCAIYEAACSLSPSVPNTDPCVDGDNGE